MLWSRYGELLLDSLDESLDIGDNSVDVLWGFSVLIFSGVQCLGGTS